MSNQAPRVDEQPRHIRRLAHQILRRRRLVIHVARVRSPRRGRGGSARSRRSRAQCSGVLPSPPRAWTSDGSASTSSRSRSNMPRCAAAKTSTTAPRSMSGAASSGVQSYSRRPNPPAHQRALEVEVRAVRQEHVEQRQVLLRHRATGRLSKWLIGAFTAARTSACSASSSRTRLTSPSLQRVQNRSTGDLVIDVDLPLHRRPALEAVAASDDELRIGKLERVGRRRLRVERTDALHTSASPAHAARSSCLRALLLHLEIGRAGRGSMKADAIFRTT